MIEEIKEEIVEQQPKRIKKRYIISILLMIVLMIGTFVIILKDYSIMEVINIIKSSRKRYVAIAFLMPFLFLFFQSLSTMAISKKLLCKTSFLKNVAYSSTDFYFSAITPSATGGQPLVLYYMKKDDIPISKGTIILLLNTAAYKIVLIFLGLVVVIFNPKLLFGNGAALITLFFIGIGMNILLCFLCLSGIFARRKIFFLGKKIIYFFHKIKIVKNAEKAFGKFQYKIKDYARGGEFIKKNKMLFYQIFLFNLLQRVALFSVAYFIYRSFRLDEYSYFYLLSIQIIISLSVDTLPIPGGVGLSEGLMLLLYHIIYQSAFVVPAMIMSRFIGFYSIVVVTMLVVITNHILITVRKKKKEEDLC